MFILAMLATIVAFWVAMAGVALWRFLSNPEESLGDKAVVIALAVVCLGIISLEGGQVIWAMAGVVTTIVVVTGGLALWSVLSNKEEGLAYKIFCVFVGCFAAYGVGAFLLFVLWYAAQRHLI